MNISVQNLFQMKTGEEDEEKKFDLFTWNLSTAYNWRASKYRLSDLSSTLRARPLRSISFNFRTRYSFYQVDENGSRVNDYLVNEIDWGKFDSIFKNPWMRLTYINASIDLRLKGRASTAGKEKTTGAEGEAPDEETSEEDLTLAGLQNMTGDRLQMNESVTGFDIPWDLTASFNYSNNRANPQSATERFWINLSMNFNLTRRWKISYRTRLDVLEKQIVSQDIIFYRDLHCWEARFVWTPTGPYKRFYFKISVKAGMLKDLKVEKGTGRTGLYGY